MSKYTGKHFLDDVTYRNAEGLANSDALMIENNPVILRSTAMSDQQRTIFIIILSCLISFAFGLMIGLSPNSKPAEKEIIELNIELTKLKIKELKGVE